MSFPSQIRNASSLCFELPATIIANVILHQWLIEVWGSCKSVVGSVFAVAVVHFLWLCTRTESPRCIGACRHSHITYECYPPYTAPGGLQTLFKVSIWTNLCQFIPRLLRYYLFPSYCSCPERFVEMQKSLRRASSFSSDDSRPSSTHGDEPLPPPVLVYHESARSIVFRDHVRRAEKKKNAKQDGKNATQIDIANFQPVIQPLPSLELGPHDQFQALIDEGSNEETWNVAEKEVVGLLRDEYAVVKTLRNSDWTAFLDRFRKPHPSRYRGISNPHDDIAPHEHYHFNSFVTSTTLLPEYGLKMRCYGSLNEYLTGVVFALPRVYRKETEDEAVVRTETWAWPSGYSAKTEFNIDGRGRLINGREEALVSLNTLREQNYDYVHKEDYCKCISEWSDKGFVFSAL